VVLALITALVEVAVIASRNSTYIYSRSVLTDESIACVCEY
jgi:hypothetical protein